MVTMNTAMGRLATTTVVLGLTVSLAACSPGTGGGTGEPNTTTVVVGMNPGLLDQYQKYADVYNATDPVAKIKLEPIPAASGDYVQQLVAQGLSSTVPDVVFNYDNLNQTLVGSDLLFDLRPWLEEGKDGLKGSDFTAAFLDQYKAGGPDGPITGIPVSADSTMLFYNKTLFAKAGVTELPNESWTMDDMYRVAKQITDAGDGAYFGLQTPAVNGGQIFVDYPMLTAYGSALYDADSNKFIFANEDGLKAWETILAPYTEGFGTPYPTAEGETVPYFTTGQAAMELSSRPAIASLRTQMTDDWDVMNLPTANGKPTVGGGSYGLSISEKSTNKEGAWAFLVWFFSKDGGMKEGATNGIIPATADGLANGEWLNDTNPVPSNLIPATKYSVQNAQLPNPVPNEAQTQLTPVLEKAAEEVVVGGKSIKEAFTAAQDTLNALLK